MKVDKKISWNFSGDRLGPRAGAEAGASAKRERRPERRPEGPAGHPRSFNFFLSTFMNTTNGFQVFLPKIFVNTAKNVKKLMNTRSQNKKNMRGLCWNPALVIFRTQIQLYSSWLVSLICLLFILSTCCDIDLDLITKSLCKTWVISLCYIEFWNLLKKTKNRLPYKGFFP